MSKIYKKFISYFRKNKVTHRDADYLFQNKEIFDATNEELEEVIKDMAAKEIPNPIARDRQVIRALVVNSIQNQRFIKSIENRNFILTLVIIGLTIFNLYLAKIQISPVLLEQERSERKAYEICKNNPTGEYTSVSGVIIQCKDAFSVLRKKFDEN